MSEPSNINIPVDVPQNWRCAWQEPFGCVIEAFDDDGEFQGAVTVSESMRGFEPGMSIVRRRGGYSGQRWRQRLYADAIANLRQAQGSE